MTEPETKTYRVSPGRTLRHDGDVYSPGATLDLTEAQAAPLLKLGAVLFAGSMVEVNVTVDAELLKGKDGDIIDRIVSILPGLKPEDMKADGTPKVKAVEAALSEDVSADQVAQAWREYQTAGSNDTTPDTSGE